MLRASGLAAKRSLELRVVPLPEGADPADLIQRDGAQAIAAAVERSVPFVRFRVERVLASGDHSSPEGQDRMIDELRPVFAQLPEGAMRMELIRMASGRLAVRDSVFEQRLTAAPRVAGGSRGADRGLGRGGDRPGRQGEGAAEREAGNGAQGRARTLSGREDTERAFLALCIASPEEGAAMLASVDIEEDFSSDRRRPRAQGPDRRADRRGRARVGGPAGQARGPASAARAGARGPPDPAGTWAAQRGRRGARRSASGGQAAVRPGVRAGARGDGGARVLRGGAPKRWRKRSPECGRAGDRTRR
jgi:hypothetical protein